MVKRANQRTGRRTKRARKEPSLRMTFENLIQKFEKANVSECMKLYTTYRSKSAKMRKRSRDQRGSGSHDDTMSTTEICMAILIIVVCAPFLRGQERFRDFLQLILVISGLD